jgi:hypothetical protein
MDKTLNTPYSVKKREGFALLVTLSVLSVVIALTMVLLSYFEEVKQDSSETKALIQADIYYTDITNILQSFKNKKEIFSVLYTTVLPLSTPDGRFSLMLKCDPLQKGVNVNWLGLGAEKEALRSVAQELLEFLSNEYELEDVGRLEELLLEEIGSVGRYVQKEQSRLHQKNGIISYQQFEEVLGRYQFDADDPNVGSVPWGNYFSFSPKAEKIDAQYSSPELIAFLFGLDLEIAKEWVLSASVPTLNEVGSLEEFVTTNGGDYTERKAILAGETFMDATECMVSYMLDERQYRFRFEYINGEAKHFEFYGKY